MSDNYSNSRQCVFCSKMLTMKTKQVSGSLRTLVFTALLLGMAYGAQAQVAYIHQDSILNNLPGYTAAIQDLVTDQEAYNTEVDQRKKSWQGKVQKLISSYNATEGESIPSLKKRMNATDTLELNLLLAEEQMIQQKMQVYTTLLQQKYAAQVQPLLDKLDVTIAAYAKDHKLTAIYKLENVSGALAYVSEKSIVTKQIIDLVSGK